MTTSDILGPRLDDITNRSRTISVTADTPLLSSEGGKRQPEQAAGGTGTFFGSVLALTSTVAGAGAITLPWAFACSGVLGGLFFLLLTGYLAYVAAIQLVRASERTKRYTFLGILEKTCGRHFGVFAEFSIAFHAGVVCIGYAVNLGNLMCGLVRSLFALGPEEQPFWAERSFLLCVIFAVMMLPLVALPRLEFLKGVSLLSLISVAFTGLVVAHHWFTDKADDVVVRERGPVQLFSFSPMLFMGIASMGTSFTAHYQVSAAYSELSERSVKKMKKVLLLVSSIVLALYLGISIPGYVDMRDLLMDNANILLAYPGSSTLVVIARVAIVIVTLVAFPLVAYGCRRSVLSLMGHSDVSDTRYSTFFFVGLIITLVSLVVALFVKDLGAVMSFAGASTSTLIVNVFPTVAHYMAFPEDKRRHRPMLIIQIIFAAVVGVIGTAMSLKKMVSE